LQKVFAGNFSLFAGKIICRNFWSLFAGKSVFAVIPANKKFIYRKFYLQELLQIKAYLQEILQIPILLQIKTINKIF